MSRLAVTARFLLKLKLMVIAHLLLRRRHKPDVSGQILSLVGGSRQIFYASSCVCSEMSLPVHENYSRNYGDGDDNDDDSGYGCREKVTIIHTML